MNDERFIALVLRHLDGALDAAEREHLWAAIDTPERARQLHQLCLDDALLRELGPAVTAGRPPRRRWIAVAAALAAAIAAGIALFPQSAPPPVPAPPTYVRRPLSPTATTESLGYPLAVCVVSGKPLLPHSHYEEVIAPGQREGRLVRLYNASYVAALYADLDRYLAVIDRAYRDVQRARYVAVLRTCPVTGAPLGDAGDGAFELLCDPREEWVGVLSRSMSELDYRYTLSMRLVRVKDRAAADAFRRIERRRDPVTGALHESLPVGGPAMARVVLALVEDQYAGYLSSRREPTGRVACVVNGNALGTLQLDPQIGGYRRFLLGDQLYLVCCNSCLRDIRENFATQVRAVGVDSPLTHVLELPPPPD